MYYRCKVASNNVDWSDFMVRSETLSVYFVQGFGQYNATLVALDGPVAYVSADEQFHGENHSIDRRTEACSMFNALFLYWHYPALNIKVSSLNA